MGMGDVKLAQIGVVLGSIGPPMGVAAAGAVLFGTGIVA
jgi:hypothetical protein